LKLMKDYDLDVHYQSGRVNVVADALSHKADYNYLPAISITVEESSIRVPHAMAQYNVTLARMLRGEIIVARSNDEGVAHIKTGLSECDPKIDCFAWMMKASYGSKTVW
jgi:hypothetical protein